MAAVLTPIAVTLLAMPVALPPIALVLAAISPSLTTIAAVLTPMAAVLSAISPSLTTMAAVLAAIAAVLVAATSELTHAAPSHDSTSPVVSPDRMLTTGMRAELWVSGATVENMSVRPVIERGI